MKVIPNCTRNLLNELTDEIRNFFEIYIPIKNICDVVSKMGGTVVENYNLDSFSIGRIQKIGEDAFQIEIPPCLSEERKNLVVSHNIAHLFIHMGFMVDEAKWRNQSNRVYSNTTDCCERQLENEFAAAFLMPKAEFKRIMNENTEGSTVHTQEIAKYFNVSTEAASNRGRWLGYLQW